MKKQVLVTADRGETRVAMLEAPGDPAPTTGAKKGGRRPKSGDVPAGYRAAEIYFERRGSRSIVGNIYKGKVDNVLPGLEAAFVDIGLDKNGFLHVDEIVLPGVEQVKRGRGKSGPRISDLLAPGQEIVVQVVKDPLKTKGARLSMELTIAGRYMVYAPTGEGVGVSRRLEDKERDRLRKEAKQLDLGGGGAIIRTAAQGAKRADFERELGYLFKLNEVLQQRVEETIGARHGLPGGRPLDPRRARHLLRALREGDRRRSQAAPAADLVLHAHRAGARRPRRAVGGGRRTCSSPSASTRSSRACSPSRVDLPSGGYLMIDYAEALTVIDINSGSFTGRGKSARLEDVITKTNLEAAEEVVNQLRLRDIGGIIVIDFIDMARARNRDAVLKTLRKSLDEDRTKTFVVEISPLGLVEMTRQNVTDGVREIMTKPCPTCDGEGVVKSEETIAIEVERELRKMVVKAGKDGPEAYLVRLNPRVTHWFTHDGAHNLHALEDETGRRFFFEGSEGLPLVHFAVTQEGAREEIEQQAVPFQAGDEVHVHIVEPHMYNEDDAVAKVDGYMIEVVNAIPYVGEKKLVHIEEAGRTLARAVLVGAEAEEAAEAAKERAKAAKARARRKPARGGEAGGQGRAQGERQGGAKSKEPPEPEDADTPEGDDETLESKPRRRGRRGGRRRSRAKAEASE